MIKLVHYIPNAISHYVLQQYTPAAYYPNPTYKMWHRRSRLLCHRSRNHQKIFSRAALYLLNDRICFCTSQMTFSIACSNTHLRSTANNQPRCVTACRKYGEAQHAIAATVRRYSAELLGIIRMIKLVHYIPNAISHYVLQQYTPAAYYPNPTYKTCH
jgi:hypothetical protein